MVETSKPPFQRGDSVIYKGPLVPDEIVTASARVLLVHSGIPYCTVELLDGPYAGTKPFCQYNRLEGPIDQNYVLHKLVQ